MSPDTPPPSESDAVRENRHALYRKIDGIELRVGEMHAALVGNSFGNPGLVHRIAAMETDIKKKAAQDDVTELAKKVDGHDRKLWFGMTLLSAIWACLIAFKEKLFPH